MIIVCYLEKSVCVEQEIHEKILSDCFCFIVFDNYIIMSLCYLFAIWIYIIKARNIV